MNPREIFSTTKNKFPSKIMKSIYIGYTGAEIGTDATRNAWWNDIVKVETRFLGFCSTCSMFSLCQRGKIAKPCKSSFIK